MAALTGKRWPVVGKRLVEEIPYLEAEGKYAVKEYACTAIDVLARRTRLAFLNVQAADEALPRVIEIMGAELGWSKGQKKVRHHVGSLYHIHTTYTDLKLQSNTLRQKLFQVTLFHNSGGRVYSHVHSIFHVC